MQKHDIYKTYLVTGQQEERAKITKKLLVFHKLQPDKPSLDIEYIEAPKTKITIGQIRNIKKHAYLKPYRHLKVIVIKEAHHLSTIAQNALLKILEEPPKNLLIILEAENKNQFLPTVLSRLTNIHAKSQNLPASGELLTGTEDLESVFNTLSKIDNPQTWIDNQISLNYQNLISQIHSSQNREIIKKIEELANAKKMIDANVNSQFVLASLVLSK